MKITRGAVETAEIATEMIEGANARIVITTMTIQTSSQQALSGQGTAATKLTDDPTIIVIIEIIIRTTADVIETTIQTIDVTVESTNATTEIATEGQSGAGEQTKILRAQSRRRWTIIAGSIFTKGMMVSFALTTR